MGRFDLLAQKLSKAAANRRTLGSCCHLLANRQLPVTFRETRRAETRPSTVRDSLPSDVMEGKVFAHSTVT